MTPYKYWCHTVTLMEVRGLMKLLFRNYHCMAIRLIMCTIFACEAAVKLCNAWYTCIQGMETGPGLTRALTAVLENGVDVVNMSYGEGTMTPDAGRFIDLANVSALCLLLHATSFCSLCCWGGGCLLLHMSLGFWTRDG